MAKPEEVGQDHVNACELPRIPITISGMLTYVDLCSSRQISLNLTSRYAFDDTCPTSSGQAARKVNAFLD